MSGPVNVARVVVLLGGELAFLEQVGKADDGV